MDEIAGGFLVTFSISVSKNEGVNEGVNRLLDCIRNKAGLRIPGLSQELNVPKKTIERWIKKLRDEKKIIFKGPAKTGGYFINE